MEGITFLTQLPVGKSAGANTNNNKELKQKLQHPTRLQSLASFSSEHTLGAASKSSKTNSFADLVEDQFSKLSLLNNGGQASRSTSESSFSSTPVAPITKTTNISRLPKPVVQTASTSTLIPGNSHHNVFQMDEDLNAATQKPQQQPSAFKSTSSVLSKFMEIPLPPLLKKLYGSTSSSQDKSQYVELKDEGETVEQVNRASQVDEQKQQQQQKKWPNSKLKTNESTTAPTKTAKYYGEQKDDFVQRPIDRLEAGEHIPPAPLSHSIPDSANKTFFYTYQERLLKENPEQYAKETLQTLKNTKQIQQKVRETPQPAPLLSNMATSVFAQPAYKRTAALGLSIQNSLGTKPVINKQQHYPHYAPPATTARFESKYRIVKKLGAGGHSTVSLVQNTTNGTYAVAKFIRPSSVWHWHTVTSTATPTIQYANQTSTPKQTRIPLEIHFMTRMEAHPNFARFIEHFEENGRFIIVMEYCGEQWIDLYDYVEQYGPVKEETTQKIFAQVVSAIMALHALGISHNDIKDENVLIHPHTGQIKLLDLGSATYIAKSSPSSLFYGTKKFAAPECVRGGPYHLEHQEVWALGSLLYVMLFKADPFRDDAEITNVDVVAKIRRQRVRISPEAEDAIVKMMEKNPMKRLKMQELMALPFLQ